MMWLLTIALTALLLLIAWAAGGAVYRIQTDNLMREARRLRHYNNVMGRTTPERAESEKDDGNKVHEQRQQEGKRISGSGRRCGVL